MSGSWTHWIRNIVPLAEHFHLYVPDMPGFGDSDAPPAPHTAEGLADLLVAALDGVLPPSQPLPVTRNPGRAPPRGSDGRSPA